jgi:hypothetical protein
MYYILEDDRGYYIEGRKGNLPNNIVARCTKDPFGDTITDIGCYDITEKPNGELIIKVDVKCWLQNKGK